MHQGHPWCLFFFFNDTATTEIYTLSLHDALPISIAHRRRPRFGPIQPVAYPMAVRSEEHTSELQSHSDLVCRLLLEKKKVKSVSNSDFSRVVSSSWKAGGVASSATVEESPVCVRA